MDLLFAWILGGLFLSMIFRLHSGKEQSLLTFLFVVLLWPILPVMLVLYAVLLVIARIVQVLSRVKV